MSKIEIIKSKCVGCKACIKVCPVGAIEMNGKLAILDLDKCILCGTCVDSCKFDAISFQKKTDIETKLDEYKNVWVFCEQKNGEIQSVSFELLNEGRVLAKKRNSKICAVLLGNKVSDKASEIIKRSVDKVYIADNPVLENYLDDVYTNVLSFLSNIYKPEIILAGATTIGRALMPRLAIELSTGLTADCTELSIDEVGSLLQTRPAYGGNIMATIKTEKNRPQMATVRHKVFKEAKIDESYKGEIIKCDLPESLFKSDLKILDVIDEIKQSSSISEADIIVAGGRGLGKAENFRLVNDLAKAIGGAVGATRGVVDKEWAPYSMQIGQTGKTVCPKLYIAVGISGAIQHLVGMQSSEKIIAINKDPNSPIFKVADIGLVGDLFEIVPKLILTLKNENN